MLTPAAAAQLSALEALDRVLRGEELQEEQRLALAADVRRAIGLMSPDGPAAEQNVVEALDLADVDGRLDALLARLSDTEARLDRQLARLDAEGG